MYRSERGRRERNNSGGLTAGCRSRRLRYSGAVILLAWFLAAGILPVWADPLREGRDLLAGAAEGFFNQSLSAASLRDVLERSYRAFAGLKEPCLSRYWQARVEYLYGFVEQGEQEAAEAERRFEHSYELAERALACGGFSDGYRLLADVQAQLLAFNGMLYKMKHGPRVRELAEKAIVLDPGNAKARLTLALYYRNAPPVAGGNPEKALEILHEIEGIPALQPTERFSVNIWLGISYADKKQEALARLYLLQAWEIYPGNSWLQEMLAGSSL